MCHICNPHPSKPHVALNRMHDGARSAARLNAQADKAVAADAVRRDEAAVIDDLEHEGEIQPLAAVEKVPYHILRRDAILKGSRQWADAFNAILIAAQA
jgi:hypothetical protein